MDGNRFNGSAENCVKWLNPAPPVPGPIPDPVNGIMGYTVRVANNAVAFDITTLPGIAVAVKVNDTDWHPAHDT